MKKSLFIILTSFCFYNNILAQVSAESSYFKLDSEKGGEIEYILLSRHHDCDSIVLDSSRTIEGLALSGTIILPTPKSFVRVLLQDKNGKEYTVLETSRIYNDVDTMSLYDYCEETKYLPHINPCLLRIYMDNAIVELERVALQISKKKSEVPYSEREYQNLLKANRLKQIEFIANNINENNKRHHRLWRAEATEMSLLPWEDKKKILGMDGRCFPLGFEYYSTGIFEIGEVETGRTELMSTYNSSYVDSFDWRNRHGINWMTSVKHQSTGSSCWAFTAVGVTEALVNLYYNDKIDYDLSEQEVISCSGCGSNGGGGYEDSALTWISNHGVSEEISFPFSNSDEPCSNKQSFSESITMNGTSSVLDHTINNNDSVKKALIKYGPLTSGYMYINDNYHGHAMVLVGYATLHEGDTIRYFGSYYQSPNNFDVISSGDGRIGKTYWIFKNSYGTDKYYDHKGYSYVLFNDQSCFRTPSYAKVPISSLLYSDTDINITDNDGDGLYFWGIGPKPSHSPSWVPDTPDGDDSNINYGSLDDYGNLDALPAGITIKTPVTYSSNSSTSYRIGIVNGGKLTITGTTTLTGNGRIRVCEGGILEIDGGTLQDADITMVPGCTVIIKNGGKINMASGKDFEAPLGVDVNILSGEIN